MSQPLATSQGSSSPASGRVHYRQVTHRFSSRNGTTEALGPIDFSIEPGELVCLVGPSGCGKTTLLRMLAGFLRPSLGEVTLDGQVIHEPGADRGVVFQQPTLFPWLSVRANVELGPRLAGFTPAKRREIADKYLELVGLAGFANHAPYELSGGMQQRVAIARTLAANPTLVLMDEPFGALDALTREHLQNELRTIWQTTGKTILFVTHSVEEAIFLGTRVIVLSPRPGRIVLDLDVNLPRDSGELRLSAEFSRLRAQVGLAIRAD